MKRIAAEAWRILKQAPLALLAPFLLALMACALLFADFLSLFRSRLKPADSRPATHAASIVIPNWNGRDLLEKYLPAVVASIRNHPGSEIIVVDDASTDGSAELVRDNFPQVRLLQLPKNLGFGGGSNAGFRAAKHDIVVLLNSDMRVESDFLAPLLAGFRDEKTFAVSCQIFFSDPNRLRQETGLTEGWWLQGGLRVAHRADPNIQELYPCFYGGGGSCAFDRRKVVEVGGFDELLKPFYLEDTDIGYVAWKRGWKVYYQPASVVYHEHRGTIGKSFNNAYIEAVIAKNFLLFIWKNIHAWNMLLPHFWFTWANAMLSWLFGNSAERPTFTGIVRAFLQLPQAMASRLRARRLAMISDEEAFRRPLAGYFRDVFTTLPAQPEPPHVLFVSPYPICPPTHGGGVFMYQTIRELARICDLHLIVVLDYPHQREAHHELDRLCASTEYVVRLEGRQKAFGSIEPHAAREFRNRDLAWLIQRQIYLRQIDVMQLEYTALGQYYGGFRRIPTILFEHDIYFQSISRRLPFMTGTIEKIQARWEYLRALRYELRLLTKVDRIQVCTPQNADYLISFLPELKGKIDDDNRAGIDTSLYDFRYAGRDPFTLLFLGGFRHPPNQEALNWFLANVFPRVRAGEARAKLIVVGSDPPPRHSLPEDDAIELAGFVEDVRKPLSRYSVFVCPILSGSGMRVKLLEAFAAGMPVVSTRVGAEGLAQEDGKICRLADDPADFAQAILDLFACPEKGAEMARRARADVVAQRDMKIMTTRLLQSYRDEIERMRTNPN